MEPKNFSEKWDSEERANESEKTVFRPAVGKKKGKYWMYIVIVIVVLIILFFLLRAF